MSISERLRQKMVQQRIPHEGVFELTPRCTMNCKMCYVVLTEEQQRKIGQELTTKQWLSLAEAAVKKGMYSCLLTGGEPFLRKDFFEILDEISSMGVLVRINSNGTLITPQVVEKLLKCRPTRLNVTLYGGSNETYERLCGLKNGFDIATRGINLLYEAGIDVKINFTGTNMNIDDCEAVLDFAKARNMPVQVSTYVFDFDHNGLKCDAAAGTKAFYDNDNFTTNRSINIREGKKYKKQLEMMQGRDFEFPHKEFVRCGAGRNTFSITWDGKMIPCILMRHVAQEPLKIGFDAAWDNTVETIDNIRLPKKCTKCEYALICRACASQIYEYSGRFDVVSDDLCEIAKEHAKNLLAFAEMDE